MPSPSSGRRPSSKHEVDLLLRGEPDVVLAGQDAREGDRAGGDAALGQLGDPLVEPVRSSSPPRRRRGTCPSRSGPGPRARRESARAAESTSRAARPGRAARRGSCRPAAPRGSRVRAPAAGRPSAARAAWRSSSSTGSLELVARVDQPQDRAGHEGRHERHHDEHREELRRDHAQLEPDVEDDQLGQAARVHQRADRGRVAQAEAAVAGGEHRADELADDRDGDQEQRDRPQLGPVERVDLGPAGR